LAFALQKLLFSPLHLKRIAQSLMRIATDRVSLCANEKLTAFLELEAAIRKNSIDSVCRGLAELRSG
jgi:hypothetical protein